MKATTIRLENDTLDRIDGLASSLSRSRSWVIQQAIERFLDYEEWYVQKVKAGLAEAERGEIASEEEVAACFRKWDVDTN